MHHVLGTTTLYGGETAVSFWEAITSVLDGTTLADM